MVFKFLFNTSSTVEMAPTTRASCKVAKVTPSKRRSKGNSTNKSWEKLATLRAGKPLLLDGSDMVRLTRSQTALRSKINDQLRLDSDTCKKDFHRVHARGLEAVGQASISGICFNKECHMRKDLKLKKSSCETQGDTKKRKISTRCTSGKSKKHLKRDIQKEDISVQGAAPSATRLTNENMKSTFKVPAKPQVDSGGNDNRYFLDGHMEIKTRIGLIRQHILEEQSRVRALRDQLARNKDTARASMSCRRIRIHKELKKLREKIQLAHKRRLQAEDHRIQRRLEAGKRKVDSERLSMRTRLAKEWRDRFQRRKSEVRRAKHTLQVRIWAYEVDKRELLMQLKKEWTAQLNRVQAMRERLEMEMVRDGVQWDGEIWRTAVGKHKYSLRRAPREKTHVYCRAWKMGNKKMSPEPKKQDDKPPSGATVYKETKQKTLMELYQILDSELRCSICSELFMSAVVLNCSHTFCSFCIKQWKKRTDRCPICRASITSRIPIAKLDPFLTKFCRRVGREVEKKRAETVKDRQGQEKELKEGGRTWGNFASNSLEDWDMEDDDDFNDSLDDSDDDSDVDEFLEILQDRVGGSAFRRFFGFGLVDDMEDSDDMEDLFSSDEELDSEDFEDLDGAFLGDEDDEDNNGRRGDEGDS